MAWDALSPDQTIRPNGTLVDLSPETYIWTDSPNRPGDVPLTGHRRGKRERSVIGTVIGHRRHYRCGATWVVHQVFDGESVVLVDLDQVWRDDGFANPSDEPTIGSTVTHGEDASVLAVSKNGLYVYSAHIEHIDTFPRRWAFRTSVRVKSRSNEHSFSSSARWLGESEGFRSQTHDGVHMTAYRKALDDADRFRDLVCKKFDVEKR